MKIRPQQALSGFAQVLLGSMQGKLQARQELEQKQLQNQQLMLSLFPHLRQMEMDQRAEALAPYDAILKSGLELENPAEVLAARQAALQGLPPPQYGPEAFMGLLTPQQRAVFPQYSAPSVSPAARTTAYATPPVQPKFAVPGVKEGRQAQIKYLLDLDRNYPNHRVAVPDLIRRIQAGEVVDFSKEVQPLLGESELDIRGKQAAEIEKQRADKAKEVAKLRADAYAARNERDFYVKIKNALLYQGYGDADAEMLAQQELLRFKQLGPSGASPAPGTPAVGPQAGPNDVVIPLPVPGAGKAAGAPGPPPPMTRAQAQIAQAQATAGLHKEQALTEPEKRRALANLNQYRTRMAAAREKAVSAQEMQAITGQRRANIAQQALNLHSRLGSWALQIKQAMLPILAERGPQTARAMELRGRILGIENDLRMINDQVRRGEVKDSPQVRRALEADWTGLASLHREMEDILIHSQELGRIAVEKAQQPLPEEPPLGPAAGPIYTGPPLPDVRGPVRGAPAGQPVQPKSTGKPEVRRISFTLPNGQVVAVRTTYQELMSKAQKQRIPNPAQWVNQHWRAGVP